MEKIRAYNIIEAILNGKEPSGLSIAKFIRREFPILWEEQRKAFDFSPWVLKIVVVSVQKE